MLIYRGFTLIELMVSMTIAMFLMLGVTVFFMASTRATMDNVKSTRVNNVMRAATELMSREIARAGYWHAAYQNVGESYSNPFSTLLVSQYQVPGDCIVYAYDADGNDVLDESEYRGFRLKTTTIEMKTAGMSWQCNEGTWQALTPGLVKVVSLRFGLTTYSTAISNRSVVDRKVSIELAGDSLDDVSVRQNFNETVNVRNDVIQ